MDKTNFDKKIYGDVNIVKERKTYYIWSNYCECGRSNCGLARGCGQRVSPFFPTRKEAIKWINQQEDKESHEYDKKTWSIKSKTKRIKN